MRFIPTTQAMQRQARQIPAEAEAEVLQAGQQELEAPASSSSATRNLRGAELLGQPFITAPVRLRMRLVFRLARFISRPLLNKEENRCMRYRTLYPPALARRSTSARGMTSTTEMRAVRYRSRSSANTAVLEVLAFLPLPYSLLLSMPPVFPGSFQRQGICKLSRYYCKTRKGPRCIGMQTMHHHAAFQGITEIRGAAISPGLPARPLDKLQPRPFSLFPVRRCPERLLLQLQKPRQSILSRLLRSCN